MNKHKVVYTHSGILLSLKKTGLSDACYNVEDIMLSNLSQSQKYKYCMIPLL